MLSKKYVYTLLIACTALMFVLGGCGDKPDKNPDKNTGGQAPKEMKNPVATIEMEDGGIVKVELYPEIAPNTVENFISLANQGFYNGLIFHRVMPGFMIQGGDPDGTGGGGPGYGIKGEFSDNAFENALLHERGVISMARRGEDATGMNYDSAGSQFFIMHEVNVGLDGKYASFGKVIEGMEVVDQIAQVETTGPQGTTPVEKQVMKEVTVETFGRDYDEPETIKPKAAN